MGEPIKGESQMESIQEGLHKIRIYDGIFLKRRERGAGWSLKFDQHEQQEARGGGIKVKKHPVFFPNLCPIAKRGSCQTHK